MKKGLFLVLCLVLVLPLIASAQDPPANEIRVYQDKGYSGSSSNMSASNANLVSAGWNDMITSIKLGCRISNVVLYENINYGGKSRTIYQNTDLSGDWWNDKISSFKIVVNSSLPDNQIRVYKDGNFSGFSSNMSASQANLVNVGWNDMISSIQVACGVYVVVYEHINYGGKSRTIYQNTDLSGDWWNDKISSYRVVPK